MWKLGLLIVMLILQPIVYRYADNKKIKYGRFKMLALFLTLNLFLPFVFVMADENTQYEVRCGPPVEIALAIILVLMTLISHLIYWVVDYLINKDKRRSENQ
jgi:uncharacterized membrane protein